MNEQTWDYIFLDGEYNESITVPEEKCKIMKDSFKYWYPMDLRCSAKDLTRNHLIFSLFNHAAVWRKYGNDMLPRAFFCNGMITVDSGDGKGPVKMSKSEGNFYTVSELVT